MKWDQRKFVVSVEQIIAEMCDGNSAEFNRRISDRDAVSKYRRGNRPSLEKVLRIIEEFHVSPGWLLYGESAPTDAEPHTGLLDPDPYTSVMLAHAQEILRHPDTETRNLLIVVIMHLAKDIARQVPNAPKNTPKTTHTTMAIPRWTPPSSDD